MKCGTAVAASLALLTVLTALNLADELTRIEKSGGISFHDGHARAANLRALLDQILIEEREPE